MRFVDREEELTRLHRLMRRREGGLAVLHGRRRIGKTRLLLEWSRKHDGVIGERAKKQYDGVRLVSAAEILL